MEVESFQISIKRDPTIFMDLKDISQFDKWHRNNTSLSKIQDVDDVLNPKYKPISIGDQMIFTCKNMYTVFDMTIKTDQGIDFVRQHEGDKDAQKVYEKIIEYYLRSTKE